MSLWSKLFGGGGTSAPEPQGVAHGAFTIYAQPINEGGRWRIGARIEKDFGGTLKTHQLIRADTLESAEAANEASLAKARMLINPLGDAIFD